tara:strand:- start:4045 stop:4749 length:705 start_codon:yes stop_codon:yes gene_type:complete
MINDKNIVTHLFISKEKFQISINDEIEFKNFYKKDLFVDNNEKKANLKILNSFLNENIYEIEKKFHIFIKNVNVILDCEEFSTVYLSIKKSNQDNLIDKNDLVYLLNEAKNDCKETYREKKIIHMLIDNYNIDKNKYSTLPKNIKCQSFSLDLRLICLSEIYIKSIEDILKKFQISISNIVDAEYIREFSDEIGNGIIETSYKVIKGHNQNEIKFTQKKIKKTGFFEKFFDFFS